MLIETITQRHIQQNFENKNFSRQSLTLPNLKPIKKDSVCFSTLTFKGHSWEPIRELICKTQIINGEKVFINIQDFINKGKDSLLCKKIPMLKATFGFRNPFKDSSYTVGDHTVQVVKHLTAQNEEFKTLNDADKRMLLMTALFHDIGKTEQIIKRTDLEQMNFDQYIKSKIKELDIFNPPQEYKQKLIDYFNNPKNKAVDEIVIHNNIHPQISVKFLKEFFTETPKNKNELEKLKFLIEHHQDIGTEIDRYQYKYITDDEFFGEIPERLAKNINSVEDLNLIKIFHISDANGIPQDSKKLSKFLAYLEVTRSAIEKFIKK